MAFPASRPRRKGAGRVVGVDEDTSSRASRLGRPARLCAMLLGVELDIEFFLVNNEAFMPPLRDQIHAIVGLDLENKLSPVDFDQLDGSRDFEARWRRCFVAHVDVRSHRLFPWPVEVGVDCPDTGPFEKADQEAGRKDFRHCDELLRFRIERRNRFRLRNYELVLVSDAGFQRVLHLCSL